MSCASPVLCVAGDSGGSVIVWNGTSWTRPRLVDRSSGAPVDNASGAPADNASGAPVDNASGAPVDNASGAPVDNMVTAVSCTGATFCMGTDSGGRSLTFDGATWSSPVRVGAGAALNSVSCVSASFCVAVDAAGNAYAYR